MKLLYILLILSFSVFAAEKASFNDKPQIMLESISKNAIRFGTGTSGNVYVFVDPLCKYSRALMTKINENKMLQLEKSYYIFLYKLPKLDSEKLIQYILQSTDSHFALVDVMINENVINLDNFKANEKTLKAVKEISEVAEKLDMKLRPYMISFDNDSKFCRVSEGYASCLDEFEQ